MIVVGARGKLNVEEVLNRLKKDGIKVQILDASVVCGKEHIEVAYEHAKRAFEEGRNKSKSIEMELMLYASGKRQIKEAIEFIGAKEKGQYAFVFFDIDESKARKFVENLGLKIDDSVIQPSIEKLKKFVNKEELKTIDKDFYFDLIFEKIAMVELLK
jgi:KEOPS complex subunit Cgi121